ncbi:MAG: alkanal monooxygenase [Litorilinea sp.]|nr:MAG: alkanal monooxygenase [Litorilinea sp.]
MANPFRLGFFTHLEGEGDPRRIYQETLDLFLAAEELGFQVGWVAQHHFHIHPGRLPAPFPFLAAVAARTRRIRLGTSLVVLPLEHPLRVAEDAAVVDLLSGGRLELGVGSGGAPAEFHVFGVDPARRHERTTAGLEQLKRALGGERLNQDGLSLDPPAPGLVERLWQGAGSVAGARFVARQGVGLLLPRATWRDGQGTEALQLPMIQAYLAAWTAPEPPRIGLSRSVFPVADGRMARSLLQEGLEAAGAWPPSSEERLSLEAYCQRQHIAWGHPEEVAARLAADRTLAHATDLIVQFGPARTDFQQTLQMLELVATRVAPALGWQPGA